MVKQLYLTLILIFSMIMLSQDATAQLYQLGTGTVTNSSTTASPVNIWYRRTISQIVYTAFELNAAGAIGPCAIDGSGWYVTNAPIYAMPGYTIKMKHTSAANVASVIPAGGWTTVVNGISYMPTVGGYDMINYSTPFNWNGVDNIAIEICWSQVSPTYNASGQCRTYATSSGYRYRRTDASGNSCSDVPGSIWGWKPQIQFRTNCSPNPCAPLNTSIPVTTSDDICAGDIANPTALANYGGSLNWYDAAVGGTLVHTGATYSHSPSATVSYWVEEHDNGSCNSLRSQVDVTVATALPSPVTTDEATCKGSGVLLTATSTSGASSPVFDWYDAATGGTLLHTGSTYAATPLTNTTYWVEEVGVPTGATMLDHGPDVASFTGMTRGYFFTAPTNFTITGLRVPTDRSTDDQSIEVVRFTAGTPPAYAATTNSFVSLFRASDVAGTAILPCNITINSGDIIGVFGSRGSNSTNSYGNPNYSTTINGLPVTLQRCGMQDDLEANPLHDIWSEASNSIGRVEMYYDATSGCSSARVPANALIAAPVYASNNATTSSNLTCVVNEGGVDWTYYYNSANPEDLLYAIAHDPSGLGNNSFTASVDITVTADPTNPTNFSTGIHKSENIATQEAYFAMGRHWNVTTTGTLVDPVNIRFYYDPAEKAAIVSAANNWLVANDNAPLSLSIDSIEWFKTDGVSYSPSTILTPNTLLTSLYYNSSSTDGLTTATGTNYIQMNGLTSFSGGTAAIKVFPNPLLSTNLSNFTATKFQKEDAKINWTTKTEEQLSHFEVERSADGVIFKTIGNVSANGGINVDTDYQLIDTDPMNGTNYYRLKLVKHSGDLDFSSTRVLVFSRDWGNVQVMPNPFDADLSVRFSALEAEDIEVSVFNALGQRVYEHSFKVKMGSNELTLELGTALPSGAYIVTLSSETNSTNRKVIKK